MMIKINISTTAYLGTEYQFSLCFLTFTTEWFINAWKSHCFFNDLVNFAVFTHWHDTVYLFVFITTGLSTKLEHFALQSINQAKKKKESNSEKNMPLCTYLKEMQVHPFLVKRQKNNNPTQRTCQEVMVCNLLRNENPQLSLKIHGLGLKAVWD